MMYMLKNFLILSLVLIVIYLLFYLSSKKVMQDNLSMTTFECGFSSYFLSRHSFSIHYFVVMIIFLFFDLELCVIMPYFDSPFSSLKEMYFCLILVTMLLAGLFMKLNRLMFEWVN